MALSEHSEKQTPPSSEAHAELHDLLEKNLKWSQLIYEQNRKIGRRLTFMVAGSYVRLILILAPIILGFIFLPPYIKRLTDTYGALFRSGTTTSNNTLETQIQNAIKKYQNIPK